MGAIYTGLGAEDGYLLATNDIFGPAPGQCAIHRVNSRCGALIVTARRGFLIRVKELLERAPALRGKDEPAGRAAFLLGDFLSGAFNGDPSFRHDPLPFLLLLVECGSPEGAPPQYVFMRNRVVSVAGEGAGKEYETRLDIHPPVAAGNLFYGHSDLAEYLRGQLPAGGRSLEEMKFLACLAFGETRRIDGAISRELRMATLSATGFRWIDAEETDRLRALAGEAAASLAFLPDTPPLERAPRAGAGGR